MRAALALLAACAAEPTAPDDPAHVWPMDDVLRVNHLQAKGTHNSYHVETAAIPEWEYTHAPLGEQLGDQGVRQFELDAYWDPELGAHRVFHVSVIDEGTTCETLVACVTDLWTWSEAHPGHHPILVLVETKDAWQEDEGPARLDALDAELLSVWPDDRLIRPDDVAADWPLLGEVRGHAVFVLHDDGARRDAYVADLTGRPLFPDAMGDLSVPWAAVHSMNDPWDPAIAEVVAAGHLVRTRADADLEEARAGDTSRLEQALASGAHFVSTDFPAPVEGFDYVVEIPGGTPSRCNPLTAPAECTSEAIETPEGL